MKKLIFLILVLCAALALVSATADEDVTGVWYADDDGDLVILTLDADGTASMEYVDQYTASGTWSLEGVKFVLETPGITYEGTCADGKITVSYTLRNTYTLEFGRDKPEPLTLSDAEVNPDAAAEDFNGSWSCRGYTAFGMKHRGKEGGELCTVENGVFAFSGAESLMTSLFGTDPVSFPFENGAYSTACETEDGESVSLKISMLQDGVMTVLVDIDSLKVTFYYDRIAE